MRIILLGAPGSGKGTQSKYIIKDYNIIQISTGDLLREAVTKNNELGKTAKSYMEKGDLVPDHLIVDLIQFRIEKQDCSNGFILDGFPRTVLQAQELDKMLKKKKITLDAVIYLMIEESKLIKRLTGRRVCPTCKDEYHLEFKPPISGKFCAKPTCSEVELETRVDDTPEKIKHRFNIFKQQTLPLVEYYQEKTNILTKINADFSMNIVREKIQKTLSTKA